MSVEKISRMLQRRPPPAKFREQLFWLVDLVLACKSSGHERLVVEARLVEDALGAMGDFLETGNNEALADATARLEQFTTAIRDVLASYQASSPAAAVGSGNEGEEV